MSALVAVVAAVHAAASPSPSPLAGAAKVLNDDTVSPGWLGLVVFLTLGAATVLLLRSFRHQLSKVPKTFDPPPGTGTGGTAGPDAPPAT